jgi:hypothetical protein
LRQVCEQRGRFSSGDAFKTGRVPAATLAVLSALTPRQLMRVFSYRCGFPVYRRARIKNRENNPMQSSARRAGKRFAADADGLVLSKTTSYRS